MAQDLLHKLEHDIIKNRDMNLVKQALKGNSQSFAKLMSFYKQRVFIFGQSFFHNDSDSEDFVQDVFIKVYTNLSTFQGKSLFSTWLMKIAWTTAVNLKNRRRESESIENEELIPGKTDSPEEQQLKQLAKMAIREAIKELPEKYSVCIEMYFYYDIPYQEISEITEIPINTIKSNIFRAKQLLRKKLEDLNEKRS